MIPRTFSSRVLAFLIILYSYFTILPARGSLKSTLTRPDVMLVIVPVLFLIWIRSPGSGSISCFCSSLTENISTMFGRRSPAPSSGGISTFVFLPISAPLSDLSRPGIILPSPTIVTIGPYMAFSLNISPALACSSLVVSKSSSVPSVSIIHASKSMVMMSPSETLPFAALALGCGFGVSSLAESFFLLSLSSLVFFVGIYNHLGENGAIYELY